MNDLLLGPCGPSYIAWKVSALQTVAFLRRSHFWCHMTVRDLCDLRTPACAAVLAIIAADELLLDCHCRRGASPASHVAIRIQDTTPDPKASSWSKRRSRKQVLFLIFIKTQVEGIYFALCWHLQAVAWQYRFRSRACSSCSYSRIASVLGVIDHCHADAPAVSPCMPVKSTK